MADDTKTKGGKKQTRQRRWTESEVVTLASLVKSRRDQLFGSSDGFGVEQRKRKMWEEVAERMQAAGGGADRGGWEGMRKKWTDVSFRAKKYRKDRQGINVTGGGPQPPINPAMEAVLDALPSEVTSGLVPYGNCETIPKLKDTLQHQKDPKDQEESLVILQCLSQDDQKEKAGSSGIQKPAQEAVYGHANSQSSTSSDANSQVVTSKKRKSKESEKKRKYQKKDALSILDLNSEIVQLEKTKIDIFREILQTLQQINYNISKLTAGPEDILTSMLSEQ